VLPGIYYTEKLAELRKTRFGTVGWQVLLKAVIMGLSKGNDGYLA
jgi:hypothetical protein